jgi:6-pyruvoyltetrahydropterin/6-carboxytetrahydropterin synthase
MFEVKVTGNFSAAHNIRGYKGNCENLHGHNYKVEVTVASKSLDRLGMVADFRVVKQKLEKILSLFDHKYLNKQAPFTQQNSTAEVIAKEVFTRMRRSLKPLRIRQVTVYESENSSASYTGTQ